MESLDEFDNEYPLGISFCERIPPQDFERQSLSYTQKSLQDLFLQMEQNPHICENVLRRRKQVESEQAGFLKHLKAKVFSMLQGDLNYANKMGEMEMAEKVTQLRQEMEKANSYSHAANKSRSPWSLEARMRCSTPLGGFTPSQMQLSDLVMPKIFGPFPKQMERSVASNPDLKQLWTGMPSVNQKSMVDLNPIMLNPSGFHPSFLGSGSITTMKYSNPARTQSNHPAPSSQNTGPSAASTVFNTPLLAKVQRKNSEERENENLGPDSPPTGS